MWLGILHGPAQLCQILPDDALGLGLGRLLKILPRVLRAGPHLRQQFLPDLLAAWETSAMFSRGTASARKTNRRHGRP